MSNLPAFEVYSDSVSDNIRFEHGISRGSNFKRVFSEFTSYIQREDTNVRGWQKCSGGTIDDFFGETYRIPLSTDSAKIQNSIATIDKDGKSKVVSEVDTRFPCYYISITYSNVNEAMYSKFISDGYMVVSSEGRHGYNHSVVSNGEIVSILPHVLYDVNLYGCEQGLSSCSMISDLVIKKFTDEETVEPNLLNYAVPTSQYSSSHEGCYTSPLPGTGCPLFVYGEDNKTVYDSIEFFFTKTNTNAVISLCFSSSTDGSVEPVWQTLSFGMMNTDSAAYKYPLYIAGGSYGLRPASFTYLCSYPPRVMPSSRTIVGNAYDFDMKSIALNNTSPLYPSKLNSTSVSNFMVLTPSGKWIYTYNYEQAMQTNLYRSDVGPGEITNTISSNSYVSCNTGLNNDLNIYNSDDRLANRLYVYAENDETGIYGDIPNMYYTSLNDKEGIVYKGKNVYLSVPNGWDERIPYYRSNATRNYINKNYLENVHKYTFNNRLLIKVGVKS